MIDPATSWFKMRATPAKSAEIIDNVLDQAWVFRCPWLSIINIDHGGEFMTEFADMVERTMA